MNAVSTSNTTHKNNRSQAALISPMPQSRASSTMGKPVQEESKTPLNIQHLQCINVITTKPRQIAAKTKT